MSRKNIVELNPLVEGRGYMNWNLRRNSTFVSPQISTRGMVGLRLGLSCLLHFGGAWAFDYVYEAPSVPKVLKNSQNIQGIDELVATKPTESEFFNRQGYYQLNPYERQDGLVASIPLLVALGIGGIVAIAAVVQNSNQARNNLQSQLDTINARIASSSNTVSGLPSSLSSLISTANINTPRVLAACSSIAAAGSVATPAPPPVLDADVTVFFNNLVAALGTNPCP